MLKKGLKVARKWKFWRKRVTPGRCAKCGLLGNNF